MLLQVAMKLYIINLALDERLSFGLKIASRRAIWAFCITHFLSSEELIKCVKHSGTMAMSQSALAKLITHRHVSKVIFANTPCPFQNILFTGKCVHRGLFASVFWFCSSHQDISTLYRLFWEKVCAAMQLFTNLPPHTNIKRVMWEHQVVTLVRTDGSRLCKSATGSLLILRLVYSGGQWKTHPKQTLLCMLEKKPFVFPTTQLEHNVLCEAEVHWIPPLRNSTRCIEVPLYSHKSATAHFMI